MLKPTKSMIPFLARKKMGELLTKLSDSQYLFHLAGSSYFKVATSDSDVDFYAAYEPGVVAYLTSNGFRMLGVTADGKYEAAVEIPERDVAQQNNTFAVYEHATEPVHVQVFYDLPLALLARDILAKVFNDEHTRTRGPSRTKMWKAAETAAREILSLASPVKAA